MPQKHFEARHIQKLLDINKDRLYHWVKLKGLITPEIEEGTGRAGRSKFSFKNLLQISLIKDLHELRFELNEICHIMKTVKEKAPLYDPETGDRKVDWDKMEIEKTDIWESFGSNRPVFEKDGYILVISKGKYDYKIFTTNESKFYKMLHEKVSNKSELEVINKPLIIIDLLEKIRGLEQKTGNKLDYYEKHMEAVREFAKEVKMHREMHRKKKKG